MKHFVGVKSVMASAMTRQEYCVYRGWAVPKDENPADQGYLIEYTDGGKPNDSRHEGYISWSPKEQFDNAYMPIPENVTGEGIPRFIADIRAAVSTVMG